MSKKEKKSNFFPWAHDSWLNFETWIIQSPVAGYLLLHKII